MPGASRDKHICLRLVVWRAWEAECAESHAVAQLVEARDETADREDEHLHQPKAADCRFLQHENQIALLQKRVEALEAALAASEAQVAALLAAGQSQGQDQGQQAEARPRNPPQPPGRSDPVCGRRLTPRPARAGRARGGGRRAPLAPSGCGFR